MRRFVLAITLICVLSGSALAGDIHTTDSTALPPPSPLTTVVLAVIIAVS